MYIADMHSDSLSEVSSTRGLSTLYNTSANNPQLTFFAAFTKFAGKSLNERRATVNRLLNVYLYETERLKLHRLLSAKDVIHATDCGISSSIFSIEGGGGLLPDCDELFTFHKAGLRVMGLAWDTNELCAAAYETSRNDFGLTYEGKRLIANLCELGITVDVSHMSDKAICQTLEVCPLPVIATHSNFRKVVDLPRNLPDELAKEIVSRGGVIGLNLYPPFLSSTDIATEEDIIRHVDYALELLGEGALGLGLDIDGTLSKYPLGFDESSSIHDRLYLMLARHYSEDTVKRIMGQNVIDFLKGAL